VRLNALKPTPFPLEPKTLGEHLKKRRHELGLIQKDVAARLGICHETYIHWEKDQTTPYTASYGPLIAFLGYDPSPAPQSLGERILARRRELGLTGKQLAHILGWDERTVLKYECNEWVPKGEKLEQLNAFLRD
jgi:transcriptional regulator with XRE-family HTH domain